MSLIRHRDRLTLWGPAERFGREFEEPRSTGSAPRSSRRRPDARPDPPSRSTMSTRMKLVGAASAALISAAMMIAPIGTAAASPTAPPDQGSSAAPDPGRPVRARTARRRGSPHPLRADRTAVGRRGAALRARARIPASTRSTRSGRPTMPPRSSATRTPGSCSRRRSRRRAPSPS